MKISALKNKVLSKNGLLLAGAAMAGIVVVGLYIRHHRKPHEYVMETPPGMFHVTDAQWANLVITSVQERNFHTTIRTDGKIASNDDTTTPVFSPYAGRVTKIFAKAGDHVERGDPLMAIAAPDYASARAQLKLATANEQRQHELYEAKTGSMKDWLQAQADLETAKGNVRAAQMERAALRDRLRALGKSDDEIKALEDDAVVTAPISGTIIQRQIGLGQYVGSVAGGASTPAFSIGDLSTVWLLANVREADAPLMHVGEPVEVRVLAYPDRIFKAKLAYVAPAIDPSTHRLPVRAELDNSDGALKPEMFASFSIAADKDNSAAAIPEQAIIYEGNDAHVWVAQDGKKLVGLRPVRVGRENDGTAEVVEGLKPGEMVVTSGSLFIDRAAKSYDGEAPPREEAAQPARQVAGDAS